MSEQQANEVIEQVKNDPRLAEEDLHWTTEYSEPVYKVTWLYVLEVAKEYIETNCPKVWFRLLFFTEEMPTAK